MIDLDAFAESIGTTGAVSVLGTGAREAAVAAARVVPAPAGIVAVNPAEMTVVCGAGTTLAELDAALGPLGQSLDVAGRARGGGGTIGGALAMASSGLLRLGLGPVRDCLLQARVVTAAGAVVKAGGPTVKNVTGFDLCRLLVGSRGTLAAIGEVIVRTRPRPLHRQWFATADRDPWTVRRQLFRPSAILWDGATVWVCLDGHPRDIADQAEGAGLAEVDGPPVIPAGATASVPPASLRTLDPSVLGPFVAEIGVGTVHLDRTDVTQTPPTPDETLVELNRRVKAQFDPAGRLNPGRSPFEAVGLRDAPVEASA